MVTFTSHIFKTKGIQILLVHRKIPQNHSQIWLYTEMGLKNIPLNLTRLGNQSYCWFAVKSLWVIDIYFECVKVPSYFFIWYFYRICLKTLKTTYSKRCRFWLTFDSCRNVILYFIAINSLLVINCISLCFRASFIVLNVFVKISETSGF